MNVFFLKSATFSCKINKFSIYLYRTFHMIYATKSALQKREYRSLWCFTVKISLFVIVFRKKRESNICFKNIPKITDNLFGKITEVMCVFATSS